MHVHGKTAEPDSMNNATKSLLIWDGDCGFCSRWVKRLLRWTHGRIEAEPSQTASDRFPEIEPEIFAKSVVLIDANGQYYTGAKACLLAGHGIWLADKLYLIYRKSAMTARILEWAYQFIARNRSTFSMILP